MTTQRTEVLDIKCIMIGDSGVGKTELFKRFKGETYSPSFSATLGVDHFTKPITIGTQQKQVKITWWDTAGQEKFRTIVESYYKNASVFFAVFDITNRASFENLAVRLQNIQTDAHKVLVAAKMDLADRRAVRNVEALRFAKQHGMTYFETSSVNNTNVDAMLTETVQAVSAKNDMLTPEQVTKDIKESIANMLSANKDPYHARVIGASKIDKTKVPTSIKKIYQLSVEAQLGKCDHMLACQKIQQLVNDYELRDKPKRSPWDKLIIWLRNVFARMRLTLSQENRVRIYTPFKEQMSRLPSAMS